MEEEPSKLTLKGYTEKKQAEWEKAPSTIHARRIMKLYAELNAISLRHIGVALGVTGEREYAAKYMELENHFNNMGTEVREDLKNHHGLRWPTDLVRVPPKVTV